MIEPQVQNRRTSPARERSCLVSPTCPLEITLMSSMDSVLHYRRFFPVLLPPEPNLKWVLEFMSYVRTGFELNDSKLSQAKLVLSKYNFFQNLYRLLGIFFYKFFHMPYPHPTFSSCISRNAFCLIL